LRFDDLVRVSLRQVVRHRRRYLGVVLAIAIGVAGFISIITMGQDVKKNFNEDLAFIGGVTIIRNVLEYRPQDPLNQFEPDTVDAIQKIPGVSVASLVAFDQIKTFWDGEPEGVYVPVGAKVTITCVSDAAETFIAGAKYDKVLEPFDETFRQLVLTAVRFHNLGVLPEDLTDDERLILEMLIPPPSRAVSWLVRERSPMVANAPSRTAIGRVLEIISGRL